MRRSIPAWPPHPPADETEEERHERQVREVEAKRVSDEIDQAINAEKEQQKRATAAKILLLGQSESGKSTVLKNFQLHFSPKHFQAEAEVWRPVIHLNLIRSVNFILNFLSSDAQKSTSHTWSHSNTLSSSLQRVCMGLVPLRQVEESLTQALSGSPMPLETSSYHPAKASEVALHSAAGWKGLMNFRRQEHSKVAERSEDVQNRRILSACADNIVSLWEDATVQQYLRHHNIVLSDQPGFFLNDVKRITSDAYKPTSGDILRARLRTIGPEEHYIRVESGAGTENTKEWRIYDVGGSRSERAAWAQFFDDVNVIIFLAPMSAFNQNLAEDEEVNRLTDSVKLWQMVCSNKLLAPVELILFLNKLDILNAKIKSGIRFDKFVAGYRSKPNETKPIVKYLLDTFVNIHQQCSPKRRRLYPHLTCAIDTQATSIVINEIYEVILVQILSQTDII